VLRSEKRDFVLELEDVYKQSGSVIVTHYHGLTVKQLTSLRRDLRAQDAKFKIVKNTLSKIAADKADIGSIATLLSGPTAIAYSKDPLAAAKTVVKFAKTNERLKIIGGIVNHQVFNTQEIQLLAELPSLDELRSKIISLIEAPATKIVGVLKAPASKFARLFQAYADKH
jgi:large subunit ribosomal protein L10